MKSYFLRLVWVGLVLLLILILTSLPATRLAELPDWLGKAAGDNTIQLTNGQVAAIQGAEMLLLLEQPSKFVYLPMVIR